jgi:CSLREA domain-containing protein
MHQVSFSSSLNKIVTAMLIIAMALMSLPVSSVSAGTVTVNITTDENANNANCSLREAIIAANNNATYNGCIYSGTGPDDIITLTSGLTYTLSLVGSSSTTGDLDIGTATSGNLTIQASGLTNAIIDANDINRVIEVDAAGDTNLTLIHITVTDGSSPDGAGIYFAGAGTLTLNSSEVSNNTASGGLNCGAGIYDNSLATVNIVNSTIKGNDCVTSGADGAGLFKGTGGTLTISNSTFSNNSTTDNGGGIRIDMGSGTATVTNSTFANNTAGSKGGGIQVKSGTVTVDFSTFSGNAANSVDPSTGGAVQADGGTIAVRQSILANSLTNSVAGADCDQLSPGTVTITNSLVEINNDCSGIIASSSDPRLDNLADNGGPTQTMALLPGSPAINLAQDAGCPAADQRGITRPQGVHCDLGAFEVESTDVNITIGAITVNDTFSVDPSQAVSRSYAATLDGPVKVVSQNGDKIVTSQRAVYGNSFNELMGYPSNQFTTEYWFPWYDQVNMSTWILVGNPSASQTAYVDIYIGGDKQNGAPYAIPAGNRITPQYLGVIGGPVRVVSVTGAGTPSPIDIFASERSIFASSFNEVMGIPVDQFTTEYWFPWYDQVYMESWILVGNPSSSQNAYVDIYIGGVKQGSTLTVAPNGNITPQFAGVLDGPVRVVSVTGAGTPSPINIFTSERSIYVSSFNEVMGYPTNQLTTDYWFTWYDNQSMATWLLVGNPSSTQKAYVDIYIAGVKQGPTRTIDPDGNITPQFDTSTGPVHVVSVTGPGTLSPINIFTSERTIYGASFNEMMGYPEDQLTDEYWFTWYDSVYMDTDIYVAKP